MIIYRKEVLCFVLIAGVALILDQWIKRLILGGLRYESEVISIVYALNKGVAFSMLSFLGESLKWIQCVLVFLLTYVFLASQDLLSRYYIAFALLVGAGVANLSDRFVYGGVVDYIYWHYGFEFAIFNFADICINLGIALLLLLILCSKKKVANV
ncbi:signal peptidase II [Helicobacter enhydrae]|uniref:Lipoprotein signal peptidase n=1 Tax=Helicobacter enhydrae TaxID=222136 RepID=A0A1B1U7L1_9HELI|nr:signal peptidase II [Helicobacter enhydrae]